MDDTRIQLSLEEAARFRQLAHKKAAITQSGQQMAQHFTKMMEEAQAEFRNLFYELRDTYQIDLASEQWDFDLETGELVLLSRTYNRGA